MGRDGGEVEPQPGSESVDDASILPERRVPSKAQLLTNLAQDSM